MQATDDRSAPMIEGKCVRPWKIRNYFSLPLLGEKYSRKAVPPKPTNLQCVRALEDWNDPIDTDSCQRQKRSCEDGSESDPGRKQRPGRNRDSRTNQPRSRSCAPPGSKKTQPTRHRWLLTKVEERSWKKGKNRSSSPGGSQQWGGGKRMAMGDCFRLINSCSSHRCWNRLWLLVLIIVL